MNYFKHVKLQVLFEIHKCLVTLVYLLNLLIAVRSQFLGRLAIEQASCKLKRVTTAPEMAPVKHG